MIKVVCYCAFGVREDTVGTDMATERPKSVTIFDIAQASGVSYSTVSRVLNGYEFVKASTRHRVLATAEALGYVPNVQARSLAGGKSRVIGLLVPRLDNGYINEICWGIDKALAKAGYDLMLYTTHHHRDKESKYVKAISNGLTDGLLLLIPLLPASYLATLRERQFPYVLIDQSDASGQSSVVDATNRQGAYDATAYLLALGHRRIGFISGIPEIRSAQDRLAGYKAALLEHSVVVDESLIVEGQFDAASGRRATHTLLGLESRPTAIFASNDLTAFGVMEAVREAGLSLPEDISVIGFDDVSQASITYPKLTTVRQPLEQLGRLAVKRLLEHIDNPESPPQHTTLTTTLVVRDSCRAI